MLARSLLAGLMPLAIQALRFPVQLSGQNGPSKMISRRAAAAVGFSTVGLFAGVAMPPAALAAGKPASDGKWAARYEPFTDEDFADMTTTASGLQYKVVEEGYGVKPVAGQKIKAHYAGYLYPNAAKFDSSYDRRSPLEFAVGIGRVIKGWDEALLDMKVGEKRLLKIPSNLAYGSRGAGGVIPPDATLVFYVELVTLAA
jgi:hypothetical protein